MIWQFDLIALSLMLVCAIAALSFKDLMSASIVFGVYSFLSCILLTNMGAVDVSFTEATVGAGISTVLFVGTALHISRRSSD